MDAQPDAETNAELSDTDRSDSSDNPGELAETDVEPAVPSGLSHRTRRYSDVSDDDRDVGWGETSASSDRGDDWYLRERPPHHG